VIGEGIPCQGKWVYLGNTPVQGARQFDEGKLEDAEKITLRIMYQGYNGSSQRVGWSRVLEGS